MRAYETAQMADEGIFIGSLDQAIELHLTSNHYPPIPTEYTEICRQAIQTVLIAAAAAQELGEDAVYEQMCDTLLELPGGKMINVLDAVELFHLHGFIDYQLDAGIL